MPPLFYCSAALYLFRLAEQLDLENPNDAT